MKTVLLLAGLIFNSPLLAPPDTEEKALLAAIYAAPAEDTPRLVYADWLQEHDQEPRARFIRLQVERVRKDPQSTPSAEEIELQKKYEMQWRPKLPGVTNIVWERGFIGSVTLEWSELRDNPKESKRSLDAINALPVTPTLVLSGDFYRSPAVQHLQTLTRIRSLEITGGDAFYVRQVESYAEFFDAIAPFLPPVRHLKLSKGSGGAEFYRQLLNWEHAPKLRSLSFDEFVSRAPRRSISAASVNHRLSGLEALTLADDAAPVWTILLQPGALTQLKELDLSKASITGLLRDGLPVAEDLRGRSLLAVRLPTKEAHRALRPRVPEDVLDLAYAQFAAVAVQLDGPCTLIRKLASELD